MRHVQLIVLVVMLCASAFLIESCSWFSRNTRAPVACAKLAGRDEFITLLPRVRRILINPSTQQALYELNALVVEFGRGFVKCLVERVRADARELRSKSNDAVSAEDVQLEVNAAMWHNQMP